MFWIAMCLALCGDDDQLMSVLRHPLYGWANWPKGDRTVEIVRLASLRLSEDTRDRVRSITAFPGYEEENTLCSLAEAISGEREQLLGLTPVVSESDVSVAQEMVHSWSLKALNWHQDAEWARNNRAALLEVEPTLAGKAIMRILREWTNLLGSINVFSPFCEPSWRDVYELVEPLRYRADGVDLEEVFEMFRVERSDSNSRDAWRHLLVCAAAAGTPQAVSAATRQALGSERLDDRVAAARFLGLVQHDARTQEPPSVLYEE